MQRRCIYGRLPAFSSSSAPFHLLFIFAFFFIILSEIFFFFYFISQDWYKNLQKVANSY